MRDGIYIRPAILRLVLLSAVGVALLLLKAQTPQIKRYVKFETM